MPESSKPSDCPMLGKSHPAITLLRNSVDSGDLKSLLHTSVVGSIVEVLETAQEMRDRLILLNAAAGG